MSTRKRHDRRRAATGVARLGSVRLLTELGPRRGPGSYGRVLTGLARLHVANPAGGSAPKAAHTHLHGETVVLLFCAGLRRAEARKANPDGRGELAAVGRSLSPALRHEQGTPPLEPVSTSGPPETEHG